MLKKYIYSTCSSFYSYVNYNKHFTIYVYTFHLFHMHACIYYIDYVLFPDELTKYDLSEELLYNIMKEFGENRAGDNSCVPTVEFYRALHHYFKKMACVTFHE